MPEELDIPASFAGGADVNGKRVVITGASRGLGRLLAHVFSHGGARVVLVAARNPTSKRSPTSFRDHRSCAAAK